MKSSSLQAWILANAYVLAVSLALIAFGYGYFLFSKAESDFKKTSNNKGA